MDDAGTEHERGWLRIEDGLISAVGAGEPPEPGDDLQRRRRHARLRQHPPSPLPEPHARSGAGRRPLHLAERRSTRSGRGSMRRWSTRPRARASPSSRSPAARPSSTTTTSSRAASPGWSRPRSRAAREIGAADRRLARVDGPRRVRRRPAARLAGRGDRRRPRRHRAARGARRRRPRPDRRRAVLAVLGHDAPDGGVGERSPAGSG